MKAVVLVGGEGTRMRPLTETTPKPLLPFMNRPFLDQVLDHLGLHGVDEAICSSPYLEAVFHDFLEARGGQPPRVRWITEEEPLGTAGAIGGAREQLGGSFLALNGDVLTDLDFGAMLAFHRERGAVATIALTSVEDARAFGLVETDEDGRVREFREKPTEATPGNINAGTYVLEPAVLERIPEEGMVSIERDTFPALIEAGEPVFGFLAGGYWRDLGTPEAYLAAHIDAVEGRIEGYGGTRGPVLGSGAVAEANSRVGELVVAGPSARIERGARVDRAVLHSGSCVKREATVEDSILGAGSVVEERAQVSGAVLAEGSSVAGGVRARGVRVGPGERLEATPAAS